MPIETDYDDMNFSVSKEMAVCAGCVADGALARALKANPLPGPCTFCGGPKGCGKFGSVLQAIRSRFTIEWSETSREFEEQLLRGAEPEFYEEPGLSIMELMDYAEYRPPNASYKQAVRDAFGDIQMHFRGLDENPERDRHLAGWGRFKQIVKHERRFTFWSVKDSPDDPHGIFETSAGEMLAEIGQLANRCKLFKQYRKGTKLWRARVHDSDVKLRSGPGLFPPPVSKAIHPQRMSPPGVVMFYGAECDQTAMIETADPKADAERRLTSGQFITVRTLVLLDLYDLSSLPSYFDLARQDEWEQVSFLCRFAHEIARPIRRDGRNHVEYVPTQAFTEFVRFQMKRANRGRIDGIRYRSSRDGMPCVVVFCTGDQCRVGDADASPSDWLSLVEDSVRSTSVRRAIERLKALKVSATKVRGKARDRRREGSRAR